MTIDSISSCLKDHSSVVFRYNSEYYSLRKKNLLSKTVYILVGTDMIPQQRDSLEELCDQVYISDGIRLSAAFAEIEIPEWNDPAWESYEAVTSSNCLSSGNSLLLSEQVLLDCLCA